MDGVNTKATLDLQFNTESLLKSATEAEKIANKTAANIAKSINGTLSNLKIGIKTSDITKVSSLNKELGKTSNKLGGKLSDSLKLVTKNISSLNRQLTKLDDTLAAIKANSNINIQIKGRVPKSAQEIITQSLTGKTPTSPKGKTPTSPKEKTPKSSKVVDAATAVMPDIRGLYGEHATAKAIAMQNVKDQELALVAKQRVVARNIANKHGYILSDGMSLFQLNRSHRYNQIQDIMQLYSEHITEKNLATQRVKDHEKDQGLSLVAKQKELARNIANKHGYILSDGMSLFQLNRSHGYVPNWVFPNYFYTKGKPPLGLPNYSKWQEHEGRRDFVFGEGGYQEPLNNPKRRPRFDHEQTLGWDGVIDIEAYTTYARGTKIRDVFGSFWNSMTDYLTKSKKLQTKRTKSENAFINGMTKVAATLTGIYGISSLMKKMGNVISEGAKINLLSQYTQEDASRLMAYNEALKRTTHQDSYGQFQNLRSRQLMTALQGDPEMASILGMSANDVLNNPNKYSVVDILDKIRNAKNPDTKQPLSDNVKQGFLMKLGMDPETAMALLSPQFDKDLSHVQNIGTFSQDQVGNMKELVNMWEDLTQDAKLIAADLTPMLQSFIEVINDLKPIFKWAGHGINVASTIGADMVHGLRHPIDTWHDLKKDATYSKTSDWFNKSGEEKSKYLLETPIQDWHKLQHSFVKPSIAADPYLTDAEKYAKELGWTIDEATKPEHLQDFLWYIKERGFNHKDNLNSKVAHEQIRNGLISSLIGQSTGINANINHNHTIDLANVPSHIDEAQLSHMIKEISKSQRGSEYTLAALGMTASHY